MNPILKRLLPIAFVSIVFLATLHAPAAAATTPASQDCGAVDLDAASSADAVKSLDCFNTAFQRCDPVSLVATGRDADTSVTWTFFTVQGDRGCRVSEVVERAKGGNTTTDTYFCSGVSREQGGLYFSGCSGSQRDVALRFGSSFSGNPTLGPSQPSTHGDLPRY